MIEPVIQVPQSWGEALEQLAAGEWGRLVVIGPPDRGKSTFIDLLAQTLVSTGRDVALLDCDLGQKMIGPPGCVTLGRSVAKGAYELQRLYFVGDLNPAKTMSSVVAGAARLARDAQAQHLVVNTSGLVSGPGLPLKRAKLDALDPEVVVGLEEGDELQEIIRFIPSERVLRLAPASAARKKPTGWKSGRRASGYRSAMTEAQLLTLDAALAEELLFPAPADHEVRLCGIADRNGVDVAVGLARKDGGQLRVLSAFPEEPIGRVRLGMVAPQEWVPEGRF